MSLTDKIIHLESFQRELKTLTIDSVKKALPNLKLVENGVVEHDWNYLLQCASIIAQSDKPKCLDAALRIAQHCLTQDYTESNQKLAAAVILDTLTNKPALNLAIKRDLLNINYQQEIPAPLIYNILERGVRYTLLNENLQISYLNRFQRSVFDAYLEGDIISISAPTSAGKSYILLKIIADILSQNSKINIVYIVPTRALISQVENDLRVLIAENNYKNVVISSIPQEIESSNESKSHILVFTQERLHWFKNGQKNFKIDLLIVDEAQKIAEGYRGILLQEKIEELINDYPFIKIFFSSPYTSNPEILLDLINNIRNKKPVNKDFVSVNQNLIFVSQVAGDSKIWEVSLCMESENIKIGHIDLNYRPTDEAKKLTFIAHELSNNEGGNLIYANGAAEAERFALQMFDVVKDDKEEITEELKELITLVKKTIHPRYRLATTLTRKIGFHYGNMPLLVRQGIEDLFSKGDIKYLFCTSTLLEGVNLPTKSIIIRKPTRGKGNPLTSADFWNLAGRAGRLGKEFQGNIVCIEPQNWTVKPEFDKQKQVINKAIDEIAENPDNRKKFLDFIEKDTPRSISKYEPNLEYAFTYYYTNYLNNNLQKRISNNNPLLKELNSEFERIKSIITIPTQIILRNPGISPLAQQKLFDYFVNRNKDSEDLIPLLPEDNDAVEKSYFGIVRRINKYLSGDTYLRDYYFAILIVNWMNGFPLSVLIQNSVNYWKKKEKPKSLDTIIRDTMKDVEEFVRFKFAKYSACYIDLLRYYFNQNNKQHLAEKIPELNIWLEFGVSQQTQISLISLGLSRNSAISLSVFIANDELTRDMCIKWILDNNIEILDIPFLMIQEIQKIKMTFQDFERTG